MRGRAWLAVLVVPWLTGTGMEDVPFEVLRERPRRQSVQAQYEVDRRGEDVIVTIHAGRKPTGGYRVEVRKVEREGAKCLVHYRVQEPPPGAMVPQVITYPAAVVRFHAACDDVGVAPPLPRGAAGGEER